MKGLIDQVVTTAAGLGLLGVGYLLWFITGVVNAGFNTKTWSWKRTAQDIAKALVMALAILGLVFLANGLDWYANLLGFNITELMDGVSLVTMLGGIILGCVNYYGKAVRNAFNFFRLELGGLTPEGDQDYHAISTAVLSVFNADDMPNEEDATKAAKAIDDEADNRELTEEEGE